MSRHIYFLAVLCMCCSVLSAKEIAFVIEHAGKSVPIEKLGREHYWPNTIIIKTKSNSYVEKKKISSPSVQAAISNLNVSHMQKPYEGLNLKKSVSMGLGRIVRITYDSPVDAYDICAELNKNPDIEYAVPEFRRRANGFTPNDPKRQEQWHLEKIQMPDAWEISKGSKEVKLAIVDTGVDWQHEDLIGNIWLNPGETPGDGIDNDGNGKIDDMRGWDFVGDITVDQSFQQQWKEDNEPRSYHASNRHGTHVAGCAVASTNNGKGIAAVGFNTSIIPLKCGIDNQTNTDYIYRGYDAIAYAASVGADVINCSWGGPGYNPAEQEIIDAVTEQGCLIIVAAGNEGQDLSDYQYYPACYNNVLTVGATTAGDTRAGFSNYGYRVNVYAPGAGIMSTYPANSYGNNSGTSMACPVTSGLACLLKSLHPEWTPKQIIYQLRSTCDDVLSKNGTERRKLYGRINARKALEQNNPQFPSLITPGVGAKSISGIITSYEEANITIEMQSYLSAVGKLNVKIEPLDVFVEAIDKNASIDGLAVNEVKTISPRIKLKANNPWFSGSAKFLLTYTIGSYTDFELVDIPITLPSKTKHTHVKSFNPQEYIYLSDAKSISKNMVWGAGYSSYNYAGVLFTPSLGAKFVHYEALTCIHPRSATKAYFGTTQQGYSVGSIMMTNDGGNNLSSKTLNWLYNVTGIHFFDDQAGIAIGAPVDADGSIAVTSNGGSSWTESTAGLPKFQEAEVPVCLAASGNRAWFGTTAGRIFYSQNKGTSWGASTVSGALQIFAISFGSETGGICVYIDGADPTAFKVATSSDGGKTWKSNAFNFKTFASGNVLSVESFAGNNMSYCVTFDAGQIAVTKNGGANWETVLNKKVTPLTASAFINEGASCRVFELGFLNYNTVDFEVAGKDDKREITLKEAALIDFDSVETVKTKSLPYRLYNQSQLDVTISKYEIIDDTKNAFKLFGTPETDLPKNDSLVFRVVFSPKDESLHTAKLVITSDNDGGDVVINLEGYGKIPQSVRFEDEHVYISPNPASSAVEIGIDGMYSGIYKAEIADLAGKTLVSTRLDLSGKSWIDVSGIPAGSYFIKLIGRPGVFIRKLVIR